MDNIEGHHQLLIIMLVHLIYLVKLGLGLVDSGQYTVSFQFHQSIEGSSISAIPSLGQSLTMGITQRAVLGLSIILGKPTGHFS